MNPVWVAMGLSFQTVKKRLHDLYSMAKIRIAEAQGIKLK